MRKKANSHQLADPLISVIVVSHNRPGMLARAIKSVLRQQHRALECIVVDDSEPAILAQVQPLLDGDARLRWMDVTGQGLDLAGKRNVAVRASGGEYIAFLDDDDLYLPSHLRRLLHCLRSHGTALAYSDAHEIRQLRDAAGEWQDNNKSVRYALDFDPQLLLVQNYIPVLCYLAERDLFESYPFDENFSVYEDWDWLIRASRRYRFAHLREVTCGYTVRPDGSNMLLERADKKLAALKQIYLKHMLEAAEFQNVAQQRQALLEQEVLRNARQIQVKMMVDTLATAPDPAAALNQWRGMIDVDLAAALFQEKETAVTLGKVDRAARLDILLGGLQ